MGAERVETHDFLSVDSFSQLPFIRPSPKPISPSSPPSNIRLFGFELPPDTPPFGGPTTGECGRKFECHYCRRNFPTSQALGGHQNAHKRERQHAKRAHLQSAMAAAHHRHHYGHVYDILNRHRLGIIEPPLHYPSWNSTAGGGPGSAAQPINGNPLPTRLWRLPGGALGMMVVQPNNRSVSLSRTTTLVGGNNAATSSPSSCTPHEGVSLDLHL